MFICFFFTYYISLQRKQSYVCMKHYHISVCGEKLSLGKKTKTNKTGVGLPYYF